MKSLAVTKDYRLEIVEIPKPVIDEDSVLLKTISCGICGGTDTKILHGTFKGFNSYPCLLGHEAIGEVIEKGKRVKQWNIGDRITLPYLEMGPDGTYYGYHTGWSAFSEFTVARDWMAMAEMGTGPGTDGFWEGYYTQKILPPDIDPVYGAMINTFREVLAACRNFNFKPGQSIVIFGAGPVGISFAKFAKLMGAKKVAVIHIRGDKYSEALKAGADYFFDGSKDNVIEEIRKIMPEGADHVLDAIGVNSIINDTMKIIKDHGNICVYGISSSLGVDLNWSESPYNWNLKFLQFPDKIEEAAAHDQIVNWVRAGVLNPEEFVSHIISFNNILDAFKIIEKREPRKKIIIKY